MAEPNKDSSTKQRSPSSNAAAALLVGMSMMAQHGHRQGLDIETESPSPSSSVSTNKKDLEEVWREIRGRVSKEAEGLAMVERQQAENENENDALLELPKGVTRRPSGAWQAQIYFAGKTRYIGVWDKPHQAATAYNLAKEALQELKRKQPRQRPWKRKSKKDLGKRHRQEEQNISDSLANTHHPQQLTITPKQDLKLVLPSSITWPSSASSSSTAGTNSTGKHSETTSPSFFTFSQQRPFKKRMVMDHLLQAASSLEKSPPMTHAGLHQQKVQRNHPISAFSHHPAASSWPSSLSSSMPSSQVQKPAALSSNGNQNHPNIHKALHHPALQLLSLRPPSPSHPHLPTAYWGHQPHPFSLGHFAPPPFSHPTATIHHKTHYSYPPQSYSPPPPSETPKSIANRTPPKPSGKRTKNSTRKQTQGQSNKILSDRQIAQNQKWKRIRKEVIGIFNEARNKRRANEDFEDPIQEKTFDTDVLRGITLRPSGKFQAQLYYGGRSRYIGVFDTKQEAASAYEMIRTKIKDDVSLQEESLSSSSIEPPTSTTSSTNPTRIVSAASSVSSTTTPSCCNEVDEDVQDASQPTPNTATNGQTVATTTATTSSANTAKMRAITPSPTPLGATNGRG